MNSCRPCLTLGRDEAAGRAAGEAQQRADRPAERMADPGPGWRGEQVLQTELERLRGELDKMGENPDDISFYSFEDGSYLIRVQDQVLFESGSASINEDGKSKLIDLCMQIKASPHGKIWVRGHTDDDPVKRASTLAKFPHGNLQLSASRAVEVAMVMINDGKIGADDVSVMGFGEHMPLKDNTSAENKRFNRRVEIYVSSAE